MRYPLTRTVLSLAGIMALGIGGFVLFDPHGFFAQNGIVLGDDPNLLSEIRAPGGVLLAAGIIMIAGAVTKRLMWAATLTAAVVFGMYGISRAVGFLLDGAPSSSLVGAMAVELLVGVYAAFIIVREKFLGARNGRVQSNVI